MCVCVFVYLLVCLSVWSGELRAEELNLKKELVRTDNQVRHWVG